MGKKENYILETFLRLTNRTYPYGTEDELVQSMIDQGIFPKELQKDVNGNYFLKIGESRTIFASHLDTACKDATSVTHVFDGKFIKTDGKTILGADDKAGVTILLHLIKNKIPGLYYFFIGEEVGCIGSGLAAKYGKFKGEYDRIISFDRRDTGSIITYQSSARCCSDIFADSLAKQLNKSVGMSYTKDEGGVYTDSAEFTHLIPECTNVSVGYYKEHTTNESQDIVHLEKLGNACLKVDWENLPVKRDPSKTEYRTYNNYYNNGWNWKSNHSTSNWRSRDYGYHDDWYDSNSSFSSKNDDLDEDEDWPGQRAYSKFKKTRRSNKRNKVYFDNGGELVRMDSTNVEIKKSKDQDYYDSLIDRILDSKLSKNDLDVVKDQYLDMNNENDKEFYKYLLGNIV